MNGLDTEMIGSVPAKATHFGVRRRVADDWVRLDAHTLGEAPVRDFPIERLSLKWIRKTFGPGRYRVLFLHMAGGVRQMRGNSRIFELTPGPQDTVAEFLPPGTSALINSLFPAVERLLREAPDEMLKEMVTRVRQLATPEQIAVLVDFASRAGAEEGFPDAVEDPRGHWLAFLRVVLAELSRLPTLRPLIDGLLLGTMAELTVTAIDTSRSLRAQLDEVSGRVAALEAERNQAV